MLSLLQAQMTLEARVQEPTPAHVNPMGLFLVPFERGGTSLHIPIHLKGQRHKNEQMELRDVEEV